MTTERKGIAPMPLSPSQHPPANHFGRQRYPNAVSRNVLAGGRRKSALRGLEINLSLYFILSYSYSQVLSRKEM